MSRLIGRMQMSVFVPKRFNHVPLVKPMLKQERHIVAAKSQTVEGTTTERDEEVQQLKERMRQLQDEIDHAKAKDGK